MMRRPPDRPPTLPLQGADDQAGERQGLAANLRAGLSLRAGDLAPAFRLPDAAGRLLSLTDVLHDGPVVLAFLGSDGAAGAMLTALRACAGAVADSGAVILALAPDGVFRPSLPRGLVLLGDAGSAVAQAYGLCDPQGLAAAARAGAGDRAQGPAPATFVVDRNARIVMSLTHAAAAGGVVAANVMSTLKALRRRAPAPGSGQDHSKPE